MNIWLGSPPARDQTGGTPPVDTLIDALDRVLQSLPRRARLTHQEAVHALDEVLLAAEASAVGPTVSDILDPVLSSIDDQAIVERGFVIDALLDARLALEH